MAGQAVGLQLDGRDADDTEFKNDVLQLPAPISPRHFTTSFGDELLYFFDFSSQVSLPAISLIDRFTYTSSLQAIIGSLLFIT